MLPIVGRYTNTNVTAKTIRVDVHTNTDTIVIHGDNSTWLKITEIGR
jgi:lactam utilization protein B